MKRLRRQLEAVLHCRAPAILVHDASVCVAASGAFQPQPTVPGAVVHRSRAMVEAGTVGYDTYTDLWSVNHEAVAGTVGDHASGAGACCHGGSLGVAWAWQDASAYGGVIDFSVACLWGPLSLLLR